MTECDDDDDITFQVYFAHFALLESCIDPYRTRKRVGKLIGRTAWHGWLLDKLIGDSGLPSHVAATNNAMQQH